MVQTVRDKRREGQLVGGTNKKHMVSYKVDVTEKTQVRPWFSSYGSQPCRFLFYHDYIASSVKLHVIILPQD